MYGGCELRVRLAERRASGERENKNAYEARVLEAKKGREDRKEKVEGVKKKEIYICMKYEE